MSDLRERLMSQGFRAGALALAAVLAIGAGGCGSGKKSHSGSSGSSSSFHAGQFCSKSKESKYKKAGLKCKKVKGRYRLK